jgi:putative transposase
MRRGRNDAGGILLILTGLCLLKTSNALRSRATLQVENLALRRQIGVLRRSARTRPKLTSGDRLLRVWLSRVWSDWRSALAIVQPETVIAWHRAGFRLFWTWKMRRGQPGRPVVSREVRDLIRKMSRRILVGGAPRIHGELLKLGIDVGESSVSKYMVRCRKLPSQIWRTFLENHAKQLSPSISSRCPLSISRSFTCFWCWSTTGVAFSTSM